METPRKRLNKYWCSVPHYLSDIRNIYIKKENKFNFKEVILFIEVFDTPEGQCRLVHRNHVIWQTKITFSVEIHVKLFHEGITKQKSTVMVY
jgi:hypothetical protein